MADPRLGTTRKGIRPTVETYPIDASTITYLSTAARGSAQVDLAVTLSASNQIALADTNDPILGQLLLVEPDGMAAVQTGGYVTLPGGVSATLTPGSKIVGAQGASSAKGYIKTADPAQIGQVAQARGMITDASVTTAVEVML